MTFALLLAAATAVTPPPPPRVCDDKPVLMIVNGPTHDGARLRAYAQKIADSGIYERLGAYYLNAPRPIATFEGEPPKISPRSWCASPAWPMPRPSGIRHSTRS